MKDTNELKVKSITRCRAGVNPVFKLEFSDGFKMQSNEHIDFIGKKYYKLMNDAINCYEYGTPIGDTSHEDFYK